MNKSLLELLETLGNAGKKMSYGEANKKLGFNVIPELKKITTKENKIKEGKFLSGLIVNNETWRPGDTFFTLVSTSNFFILDSSVDQEENYHLQMQRIHPDLYRQAKPSV